MKRFVYAVMAVAMTAAVSFAGMPLMIGGGVNLSSHSYNEDLPDGVDQGMLLGFHVGANTVIPIADKMGVLTGLNFETRGGATKFEMFGIDVISAITMRYINIPALFSYNFTPELAVAIGPEIGIALSGTTVVDVDGDEESDDFEDYNALDLGLSVLSNYTISEKIVVGLGYDYGLMNVADIDDDDANLKNRNFKILVAYKLNM